MALAFGLGGRDVASRMLNDAYRRGQEERARRRGAAPERATDPTGSARMAPSPGQRPAGI
jgi:hypothetical protein